MRRVSRTICLAAAICATVTTTALAVAPPAGTPDLSQMTIQASNLRPGAKIGTQGYGTPPAGIVADYSRDWTAAVTSSGVRLQLAGTSILLLPTPANAATVLAGERRIFGSKADRPLVARLFTQGAHSKIKPKDISFGRVRGVTIGDGAFLLPLTVHQGNHRIAVDIYEVEVADVVAENVIIAAHPKAAAKGGHELTVDVAANIQSVLAATGTTGQTGPTGATG
ncbi:MAG TPA: hypothetical protein VID68_07165 [Solirubrobacteraceae bacterium]|jgi:hypothetical protein